MKLPLKLLAAATAALALTACGNGKTDPAVTTTAAAPVWNPCTDVGDDLLLKAQLDPATERKDTLDVHFAGWEMCGWKAQNYKPVGRRGWTTDLLSTNGKTLDDIRKDSFTQNPVDITVSGRPALQYQFGTGLATKGTCQLAIPNRNGMVLLLFSHPSAPDSRDPCVDARNVADTLMPALPK